VFTSHFPTVPTAYGKWAHSITPIPYVDLIHSLHEPHSPSVVDPDKYILLPLCIRHYVCQENTYLVIGETRFIDPLQQCIGGRDQRRCVTGRKGKLPTRGRRVYLIRTLTKA
jgi:hypothetical protein